MLYFFHLYILLFHFLLCALPPLLFKTVLLPPMMPIMFLVCFYGFIIVLFLYSYYLFLFFFLAPGFIVVLFLFLLSFSPFYRVSYKSALFTLEFFLSIALRFLNRLWLLESACLHYVDEFYPVNLRKKNRI